MSCEFFFIRSTRNDISSNCLYCTLFSSRVMVRETIRFSVGGWLVIMHTYLYYFPLSLSLPQYTRTAQWSVLANSSCLAYCCSSLLPFLQTLTVNVGSSETLLASLFISAAVLRRLQSAAEPARQHTVTSNFTLKLTTTLSLGREWQPQQRHCRRATRVRRATRFFRFIACPSTGQHRPRSLSGRHRRQSSPLREISRCTHDLHEWLSHHWGPSDCNQRGRWMDAER